MEVKRMLKLVQLQEYDVNEKIPFIVKVNLHENQSCIFYVLKGKDVYVKSEQSKEKQFTYQPIDDGKYKVRVEIYDAETFNTALILSMNKKNEDAKIAYLDYEYDEVKKELKATVVLNETKNLLYSFYLFNDNQLLNQSIHQVNPTIRFNIDLNRCEALKVVATTELCKNNLEVVKDSIIEIIK